MPPVFFTSFSNFFFLYFDRCVERCPGQYNPSGLTRGNQQMMPSESLQRICLIILNLATVFRRKREVWRWYVVCPYTCSQPLTSTRRVCGTSRCRGMTCCPLLDKICCEVAPCTGDATLICMRLIIISGSWNVCATAPLRC
jgi:hypothetical protein